MGIMMRQVAGHPLLPAMFALRRRTVLRWLIPLQTKNIVECYVGDGVGKARGGSAGRGRKQGFGVHRDGAHVLDGDKTNKHIT